MRLAPNGPFIRRNIVSRSASVRRVGGLSYARWKIPHTFETRGECSSPSVEVLLVVRWLYFMEFRITFMLRASCFVFVLDSGPIRGGTMKIGSDRAVRRKYLGSRCVRGKHTWSEDTCR